MPAGTDQLGQKLVNVSCWLLPNLFQMGHHYQSLLTYHLAVGNFMDISEARQAYCSALQFYFSGNRMLENWMYYSHIDLQSL